MRVAIYPSRATGTVTAPPSKSVAHRALICGALTNGCTVENLVLSEDINATLRCLQTMGAFVRWQSDSVHIGGMDPSHLPDNIVLDCGESGSTLRFLLPLCLLSGKTVTLCGQGRLMERPLNVYEDLCREKGFLFERSNGSVTVCGRLAPGTYRVPGNVSSQFVTGLLYALSMLPGESRLEVSGRLESASYIDITLAVFSAFGVDVQRSNNAFTVAGQRSFSRQLYRVEGDCSNAAYLEAFNCVGGAVKLVNFTDETPQGDRVYRSFFADLMSGNRQFDLTDCPDLGPVMFALAATLGGAEFSGTARLRIKESDRVAAMAEEMEKFGIQTEIEDNTVRILPGILQVPSESLWGHNDHRIVMALSLLCSVTGGTIDGAQAVSKSFPDYFDVIQSLGIEMKLL